MGNSLHIVTCGYNLYLDSIVAGLEQVETLNITRLHVRPDVVLRIIALAPDVVIVDNCARSSELVLALLHHGFPVLELDAQQSAVSVLSKQHIPVLTITDLLHVVERAALRA